MVSTTTKEDFEEQGEHLGTHRDADDAIPVTMAPHPMAHRKAVNRAITVYVFAFVICYSLYFTFYTAPAPVWFHLHPLIAGLGFYSLSIYAILLKKENKTRRHSYVMFIASAAAALGVWVAYQDKSSRGKSHFVSTHAQFGLAALMLMVAYPFLSWVLLNPDNGIAVGNSAIRKSHRWLGQSIMIVTLIALGYGLAKYEKNQYMLALLVFAMGCVSPWVLR